jgi:peptide/nickel transport system permease protein
MVGLSIIVILVILCVFAGVFTKYPYSLQSLKDKWQYPSWQHLLGTDNLGRDLWSRMLYGGRVSLMVAFLATLISTVFGVILGAISGYYGGMTDTIITRILDILMAVPGILLAIAIAFALGSGPVNTALAISIAGIPFSARLLRATVMTIKSNEYIEAGRAAGSKNFRIIFVHVLPNTIAPLIVNASLWIAGNIMAISGLSFIGLGVHPPTPEWGAILIDGRPYFLDFWPTIVSPSIFIMLTLFGFNLLGDGLRDALDPRLKD